jgi:hypothetical protein
LVCSSKITYSKEGCHSLLTLTEGIDYPFGSIVSGYSNLHTFAKELPPGIKAYVERPTNRQPFFKTSEEPKIGNINAGSNW